MPHPSCLPFSYKALHNAFLVAFCTLLSIRWAVCFPEVNVGEFSMALLSTVGAQSLIFPMLLHFVDHGQHLDLLQQVHHSDGVDPVTQGLVQGTSEGVIGTVCELVLQLIHFLV